MMEFTFEKSAWEQALKTLHPGDTLSGAKALVLMEEMSDDEAEEESVVEVTMSVEVVADEEAPALPVCPVCGAKSEGKFCPECGAPMNE